MSDKIKEILALAIQNQSYKPLMDYLTARDRVPDIKTEYIPYEAMGVFSRNKGIDGRELGPAGAISLRENRLPPSDETTNTLLHELTHAAQHQLDVQYYDNYRTAARDSQFNKGYEKLVFGGNAGGEATQNPIWHIIKKLPGGAKFLADTPKSRTSESELRAYGVGNASVPQASQFLSAAPQHVDPTMATEFMILLDLAMRDMAKQNKDKK